MSTASRASINRANAQRSTGPRTESGKKVSSLNALRHGLTGDLGFSEKNHITINAEQLTLVKYDAASKQWVEVKD